MPVLKVRPRALVLGAASALFLAIALPGAVLHGFSLAASWEVYSRPALTLDDHNGIKHAYAAAEIYTLLRSFAGPECAAAAVITLGEWNERIERRLKRTTDWSPEVYKDLRNNLIGIEAAEWLYAEAGFLFPRTRLRLIGKLAQEGVVLALDSDPRIPELPLAPDTGSALARMEQDERDLRIAIAADIAARAPDLRTELGLVAP